MQKFSDVLFGWNNRLVTARSRFGYLREHEGNYAAVFILARDIQRFATNRAFRLRRRFSHLSRFVTMLLFPNHFRRPGVLFIGYVEAGLGLGESLRGLVRSIAATEIPFALYPFNRGVTSRLIGPFMKERYDTRNVYAVNLIEMSADQVPGMFSEIGRWRLQRSYNILRTYWELPRAPSSWRPMLAGVHEIWAPNQAVRDAFTGIFDGPIKLVPPCVSVEAVDKFTRDSFGMDKNRFYFIFSFDYFSSPYRKNPLGVVQAFAAAFPTSDEPVGLIIKSTHVAEHAGAQYKEIKSAILEAARRDRRILVIDRALSRDEMLSLIRESDCYVSLHRAEGFGLGMAEAMALGKAVIGTDYSGSGCFLSDRTGFPVAFTLRPIQPGEYLYSDGQSWAEPDLTAAADAMRRVVYDKAERQRRALEGKNFVETHYGRETVGRIAAGYLRDILLERSARSQPPATDLEATSF